MKKIAIKIDGMMCSMCESHVNDAIRNNFRKAKKVKSSHIKGETTFLISDETEIDEGKIRKIIEDTGYKVLGIETESYKKMGLFRKYVNQTRKPQGFLGKMMVNGMNVGHAKLADWGMSHLAFEPNSEPKEILELGCGGGRNACELMKRFAAAKMTAIDYSEVSVGIAKETNKKEIESGRCVVMQGDVSALDLPEEKFDLATAFETIYFWPGLEKCFGQVAKVLKKGASFLIVNESDGTDSTGLKFEKIIDGMKCHKVEQIESSLKSAGFSEVKIFHHEAKPWICVLAKK